MQREGEVRVENDNNREKNIRARWGGRGGGGGNDGENNDRKPDENKCDKEAKITNENDIFFFKLVK